jgi:monovalent cation/proton antiporter MnhG/PhaG subunit
VSGKEVLIAVLLGGAALIQFLGVLGVWLMPNAYDRIHFLTPATSVAPWLVAGAVWTREAMAHQGIIALLVAVFLLVFQPVITHATIRAARTHELGDWRQRPGETVHRKAPQ